MQRRQFMIDLAKGGSVGAVAMVTLPNMEVLAGKVQTHVPEYEKWYWDWVKMAYLNVCLDLTLTLKKVYEQQIHFISGNDDIDPYVVISSVGEAESVLGTRNLTLA